MKTTMTQAAVLTALLHLPALGQDSLRPPAPALPVDFRVPIHAAAGEEPGTAGLWAAGPSYKASFHDGFCFYPVLGQEAPRNRPWRWRTTSVARGREATALPAARSTRVDDFCHVYELGVVREVYDVRIDGIEQSFVLHQSPGGSGDLIITGAVATDLRGIPRDDGGVDFVDDAGRSIVGYSRPVAIDARGGRFPMRAEVDGTTMRLVLAATHADDAVYPLTVDPLIGRTILDQHTGSFGFIDNLRIAAQDETATQRLLITFTRQSAAADHDAFALTCNGDFSAPTPIFADVSAARNYTHMRPAYVAGFNRWVIALQRDFCIAAGCGSEVSVYMHARGNTTINSGVTDVLGERGFQNFRFPEIAGSLDPNGTKALIAFQVDFSPTGGDTASSEVFVATVDVQAQRIEKPLRIEGLSGTRFDRELPHVNQVADGQTWLLTWQQLDRNDPGGHRRVRCIRCGTQGTIGSSAQLSQSLPVDDIRPRIAGRGGEYLLSYAQTNDASSRLGREILVRRFRWPDGLSQPMRLPPVTVATAAGPSFLMRPLDVAFDGGTESHWVVTYQPGILTNEAGVVPVRVGSTGGVVEQLRIPDAAPIGGGLTYDAIGDRFALVTSNSASSKPVIGTLIVHDAAAATNYGIGCAGRIESTVPYAGGAVTVRLVGTPTGAIGRSAVLLIGGQSLDLSLDSLGMIGCRLLLDPLITLTTQVRADRTAALGFVLPDQPAFLGDAFAQWAYVSNGANPLNLVTSDGLHLAVRP